MIAPAQWARDLADGVLEASVVGSFTRVGYAARRTMFHWEAEPVDLTDRVALVTGATGGIGFATAGALAGRGAEVWMVGRDAARLVAARDRIAEAVPHARLQTVVADLGVLDDVRACADTVKREAARLDVLRSRTKWRLLVAGSGDMQSQLAQAVKSQGLTHRVRLLGWQAEPAGPVHASDAVLLPSLCEGLPRSLIEAQAAGLPCVASDIRGNREVVTEGTGQLCPAKNATHYAEALVRLLDNPQLVSTMGQRARQHAEQCFDTVANNRQIVGIYESLLDS